MRLDEVPDRGQRLDLFAVVGAAAPIQPGAETLRSRIGGGAGRPAGHAEVVASSPAAAISANRPPTRRD
jgi:hypothetical protein